MSKKYGLILPQKGQKQPLTFQVSRNVFGNDSDEEENATKKPILLRPNDNPSRQAKIIQEKAILDDPTVYQYDEIYDDVISKKEKEKVKSKEDKKPKYIENLMKSASKRKIENERRVERQIQKEREKEGDEFKDKEVFVTTAYKKKLEEMKLEEEKEKREEYLESIGDVTKQRDLGGFYRHLYEQKLGSSKNGDDKESSTSEKENIKKNPEESKAETDSSEKGKKRNYRQRQKSSENNFNLSDGEIEDSDEEINRVNLDDLRLAKKQKKNDENIDADSDFSIDESSDEETEKTQDDKVVKQPEEMFKKPLPSDSVKKANTDKVSIESNTDTENAKVEPKPKIDIWKKRTVGVAFDEALKRYYERKAARGR